MTGRIAIPIHNESGELVAYCGRWTREPPEERPKYLLPSAFHKSQVIFNLHRAMENIGDKELIVVEGFFGLFHIWQAGFENAVALMGNAKSAEGTLSGAIRGSNSFIAIHPPSLYSISILCAPWLR